MSVMKLMGIVVTQHPSVVPGKDLRIDVGQVVPRHPPLTIDPNLTSDNPVSSLAGNDKTAIDNLFTFCRHD